MLGRCGVGCLRAWGAWGFDVCHGKLAAGRVLPVRLLNAPVSLAEWLTVPATEIRAERPIHRISGVALGQGGITRAAFPCEAVHGSPLVLGRTDSAATELLQLIPREPNAP